MKCDLARPWVRGALKKNLYDYRAILGQNELIDFSRNPDPFSDGLTHFYENQLICSLIFSKTIWILLKTIAKKINFPPRNHYFGVFHIDYHPMHYSITKKHTLSLHVKNIDIKNYAINSATADVLGGC